MWTFGGAGRGQATISPATTLPRQMSTNTSITVNSHRSEPSQRPKSIGKGSLDIGEHCIVDEVSLVKTKSGNGGPCCLLDDSTAKATNNATKTNPIKFSTNKWIKYLPQSWQVETTYNALGQSEYEMLMFFRPSIRVFHVVIAVILTSINIRMIFYPLTGDASIHPRDLLPIALYVLVSLLHIIMLWTTKIVKNFALHRWATSQQTIPVPFMWLDDMSVVCSSLCFSFCMLLLTIFDRQPRPRGTEYYLGGERGIGFFNEMVFYTLMVPLVLQMSLLSRRFAMAMLSWCISSISCILAIAVNKHVEVLPMILFFMIISGLSVIIYLYDELHRKEMLFMRKSLETSLSSNHEINEEVQRKKQDTVDMRHMIANTAHDMKTPLAATVNGCEIVIDLLEKIASHHAKDPLVSVGVKDCVETLTDITNTSRFMVASINRCLDYAKLSDGVKLMPRLETCNVYDILKVTMHCLGSVSDRDKVQVADLPVDMCPYIITDTQWLQENVLCLASNAVKFCPQGGIRVSLSVQEHVPVPSSGDSTASGATGSTANPHVRSMVCVEVEDHGVGISKDMQRKLFEPFQQAQRHAGGTGLGLFSLSKRIEALGGQFGVGDRKDGKRGSLFWFTFPYRPDEAVASLAALQQSRDDYDHHVLTVGSVSSHASVRHIVDDESLEVASCHTSEQNLILPVPVSPSSTSVVTVMEGRSLSVENLNNVDEQRAVQQLVSHLTVSTMPPLQTITPRQTRTSSVTHHRHSSASTTTASVVIQATPRSSSISLRTNEKPVQLHSPYIRQGLRNKKPLCILLVDDSQAIQKMTGKLLQQEGHFVCAAMNGLEALQQLAQCDTYPMLDVGDDDQRNDVAAVARSPPPMGNHADFEKVWCYFDVIIMDLNMPVMDGLECTRRIRSHERQQRLATITSTSSKKHRHVPEPTQRDVEVLRSSIMYHAHDQQAAAQPVVSAKTKSVDSLPSTSSSSSSQPPAAPRFPFLELMRNSFVSSTQNSAKSSVNLGRSSTSSHLPTQRYSMSNDAIPEDEQHVMSVLRNFSIDEDDNGAIVNFSGRASKKPDSQIALEESGPARHHQPSLDLIRDGSDNSIGSLEGIGNRRQRQLHHWHQRIIGCSANDDEDTIQETIHAGADTFLRKPFKLDAFYQTLDALDLRNTPVPSLPNTPKK